ncbi:MAG: ATP-dependent RecD-like DNA helicase [Proteobacteria bacterium]|nr:ATP-dependent RecD-like DNA helicase [Pseudomonadota bacterium]MBU1736888.1 ATP-dependent RecD-like DNA helicase [Pseudomonadota bacterium]
MNADNAKGDEAALEGILERITFHSEETGFTVARLREDGGAGDLKTIVGTFSSLAVGSSLSLIGKWEKDSRHGEQFKVEKCTIVRPSTLKGIEKYLGSGLFKGIGPAYAGRIVKRFGIATLEVLDKEPGRLREVQGLGRKKVAGIKKIWQEQRNVHEIMVFLQSHEISAAYAVKIYKVYGDASLAVVRENPYRLSEDIWGIGFLTADRIARSVGMAMDDPRRARAGVLYTLNEATGEGHCFLPEHELLERSSLLLAMPVELIIPHLPQLVAEEKLVLADKRVYPANLYAAETGSAANLLRIGAGTPVWCGIDCEAEIVKVQKEISIALALGQSEALQAVLENRLTVITGGPGTGKSTILKALVIILENKGFNVSLAAPTGRAAKRLGEATGREARTIHRLLEFDPSINGFKRNRDNCLDADLVIVDEVSMLDIILANALLRSISATGALVLVGDADQLPSVGPGNFLKDIIEFGRIKVSLLTRIFRQDEGSLISINGARVNRGEPLELLPDFKGEKDFYYISRENPDEIVREITSLCGGRLTVKYGFDPLKDIQVLSPMRKGLVGIDNLNSSLQEVLNPGKQEVQKGHVKFRVGDKVMQLRNNYDKDVFNGDLGFIETIDEDEQLLILDIEGRKVRYEMSELSELQLAYAITVHKSQGSEFPCIILPVHTSHYPLLQRNLVYTGITRGRQLVVIVGSRKALGIAIRNDQVMQRNSGLKERLADGCL